MGAECQRLIKRFSLILIPEVYLKFKTDRLEISQEVSLFVGESLLLEVCVKNIKRGNCHKQYMHLSKRVKTI